MVITKKYEEIESHDEESCSSSSDGDGDSEMYEAALALLFLKHNAAIKQMKEQIAILNAREESSPSPDPSRESPTLRKKPCDPVVKTSQILFTKRKSTSPYARNNSKKPEPAKISPLADEQSPSPPSASKTRRPYVRRSAAAQKPRKPTERSISEAENCMRSLQDMNATMKRAIGDFGQPSSSEGGMFMTKVDMSGVPAF